MARPIRRVLLTSPGRLVTVLAAFALLATGCAGADGKSKTSQAPGLTRVSQLANAPVPASCKHPAATLEGMSVRFADGAGDANLDTKHAAFGDLDGDGNADAVVPLNCNSGGEWWPQLLLVYGDGPRLLGSVDLGSIRGAQEHVEVNSLHYRGGQVSVEFASYVGSGLGRALFSGTLTYAGKAQLDYSEALTIDYAEGRVGFDPGPGVVLGPKDSATALKAAPDDLQSLVQNRWASLQANASTCGREATLAMSRYSHLGFFEATEVACDITSRIWAKRASGWVAIHTSTDDLEQCSDLTEPELKRAWTALGLGCFDDSGTVTSLGDWPSSGR